MLPVCSQKFGSLLARYGYNHFDAQNQFLGFANGVNVPEIYRKHANRLKNAGL
jgi:triacylglycerol esterase/lipase EstA (alpha/beta hydrolase family)